MPLKALRLKPGIFRENTRYSAEGGWYECDKVRFRSGQPEKIGGWQQVSNDQFLGYARALWPWEVYLGLGTEVKYYVYYEQDFYDITPIRVTGAVTLFYTYNGVASVSVDSGGTGYTLGDLLTVVGGTGTAATLTVTGETGGVITSVSITTAGSYTVFPTSPVSVTGGSGSSATFNLVGGFPYVGVVDTSTGVGTFATGELTVGTYVTYTTPGTVGGINLNTAGVDGTSEYSILSNVTLVTCSTSGTTLTVASVDSPGIIVTGATITINGTPYTLTGTGTTGAYTLSGTPSPAVPAGTQLGVVNTATYFIQASTNATSTATGGAATVSKYQPSVGAPIQNQSPGLLGSGWGLSGWGSGGWGGAGVFTYGEPTQIGLWNAYNFGEDLIYGPKGGAIYYWDASAGFTVRGINIATAPGASANVPVVANYRMVSDASRIVLVFGTNPWGTSTAADLDPMLIRWSDQEDYLNWEPSATTQAGDVTLSRGSEIRAVAQTRQEILVWTDIALYSLQYIGAPEVWRSEILADNITIVSDRAWAVAAGVTYWMGDEKFYVFDGRVQTLNCDIRKFIFDDFNSSQRLQVFASTVEQFSEVWWFYCSITGPDGTGTPANPNTVVDRYAVFNYAERIWYYGSMGRTAWLDASVISNLPIAADYNRRLLNHETGCDDASTTTPAPIESYITSSEFDIDDGHNFGFVRRMLPDVTFTGSTAAVENQSLTMALLPLQNSGSGYTRGVDNVSPAANMSVALTNEATVQRDADNGIERFSGTVTPYDGNLYIRVRGRQMALRVASTGLGVQWQLGTPRMDVRPSGRKS